MGRGPSIAGRKGVEDAKRGKLFTKFIREITVAARTGGGDPRSNSRLRLVLDKAFDANMPKDTADRAIKRGTGEGGADSFGQIATSVARGNDDRDAEGRVLHDQSFRLAATWGDRRL